MEAARTLVATEGDAALNGLCKRDDDDDRCTTPDNIVTRYLHEARTNHRTALDCSHDTRLPLLTVSPETLSFYDPMLRFLLYGQDLGMDDLDEANQFIALVGFDDDQKKRGHAVKQFLQHDPWHHASCAAIWVFYCHNNTHTHTHAA